MIVSITQNNFEDYLKRSEGYIVNKTFKTNAPHYSFACAHDLAHRNSKTCRFAYSLDYPKFYASTLQEAQVEAQRRWNLPFEECSNCA